MKYLKRRNPRPKRAKCPRCKHLGFTQSPAPGDGRPMFTCTSCKHQWTCGHDGGRYALELETK